MEKFSIDIETYYKPDTGNQVDVFSLSSAEKRQRTVGKSAVVDARTHPLLSLRKPPGSVLLLNFGSTFGSTGVMSRIRSQIYTELFAVKTQTV